MVKEGNLNKRLYKTKLLLLKFIPAIIAFCYFLNTIFSYFDIDISYFSYVSGISFLPLVYFYIESFTFKFCIYHRLSLHYVVVNNLISTIDYEYRLPISDWNLLVSHIIIMGIFLFLILYLYARHHKNPNKINT